MRKNGLRAFGLCLLAALGLMAFSASAQAEPVPAWMVEGHNIAGEVGIQTEGLEGNHGQLLATIGATPIEILCTNMEFEEGVLKPEGKSLGFIKFTGCQFKANGAHQSVCDPTGGEILTNRLKDQIVLHPAVSAVEGYDELVPETGETFVVIHTSEECSFGEGEIPVTGKFFIEDCLEEGRVEKVSHLIEEFTPLTELFILGNVRSTIDGSSNVHLTGANTGKTWSGLPA